MQNELLQVTGMTCGGCTSKVTKALTAIHGVSKAEVSLAAGEAAVQYDERLTSRDELQAAVKKAGFGLGEASSATKPKTRGCCCG